MSQALADIYRVGHEPREKKVTARLSIKEVEELTGLAVVDIEPSKNWVRLVLANGVRFSFRKWN